MEPIKQLREKMGTAKLPGVGLIDFVSYLDALSIVEELSARITELEAQVKKMETEISFCPMCNTPVGDPLWAERAEYENRQREKQSTGAWSRDDRRKIAMMCE